MSPQDTYDLGAATAERLRSFSEALAADADALELALSAFRASLGSAAARFIDEQVGIINAEVFGIEEEES